MQKINQSGRSMVEMLGVLAIIGVLSVGGIAGYSKAMNKYKVNKTNDQISMLVANIRTLYASQTTYKDLDNKAAKSYGVVPSDMYSKASDSNLTNAYGGNVTIQAASIYETASDDNRAFVITYEGLSKEACMTIMTSDWGSDKASGLLAIGNDVSGAGVDSDDGTDGAFVVPGGQSFGAPATLKVATGICTSDTNGNTVAWKYY